MKMTITESEVRNLTGKFILQVNSDNPDMTITEQNWSFVKEKRLRFICGLSMMGFYYPHTSFETVAEFVTFFNDYIVLQIAEGRELTTNLNTKI